jgi:phage shock protein E
MLEMIKSMFGMQKAIDFKEAVDKGAVIIDVRSVGEFKGGHIKGSINYPLDSLSSHLDKLDKEKVIITCCASGMRSASAKSVLKSNGFENVHNGGGWQSLSSKIN